MFDIILAAVDGSTHSEKALEYAGNLAEGHGSDLFLVHAFPHTADLRGYSDYARLIARRVKEGQVILNAARKILGDSPLNIQEELLEGPAADAIISVAKARKADLIVMGTRGHGSLKGVLFGSVSNKVSHYAPCTVMVVR